MANAQVVVAVNSNKPDLKLILDFKPWLELKYPLQYDIDYTIVFSVMYENEDDLRSADTRIQSLKTKTPYASYGVVVTESMNLAKNKFPDMKTLTKRLIIPLPPDSEVKCRSIYIIADVYATVRETYEDNWCLMREIGSGRVNLKEAIHSLESNKRYLEFNIRDYTAEDAGIVRMFVKNDDVGELKASAQKYLRNTDEIDYTKRHALLETAKKRMIAAVEAASLKYMLKDSRDPHSGNIFRYFNTPEQRFGSKREGVPILAFTALARKILDVQKNGKLTDKELTCQTLHHWANFAYFLRCYSLTTPDPNVSVYENDANFLGEFLTILFRGMIYSPDYVKRRTGERFSKKGNSVFIDEQWFQLCNFPELGKAAFDCEDGAGLIMTLLVLLYAVRDSVPKVELMNSYPLLGRLVEILNRYIPFFCIGELKTGPHPDKDYDAHAFVILLPRDAFMRGRAQLRSTGVQAQIQASAITGEIREADVDRYINVMQELNEMPLLLDEKSPPPIIVESTTYTEGAFTQRALSDTEAFRHFVDTYQIFDVNSEFYAQKHTPSPVLDNLKRHKPGSDLDAEKMRKWKRFMKIRAPVRALVERNIYRNIFTAVTPFANEYDKNVRYEHFIFTQNRENLDDVDKKGMKSLYSANLFELMSKGSTSTNGIQMVSVLQIQNDYVKSTKQGEPPKVDFFQMTREIPVARAPVYTSEEDDWWTKDILYQPKGGLYEPSNRQDAINRVVFIMRNDDFENNYTESSLDKYTIEPWLKSFAHYRQQQLNTTVKVTNSKITPIADDVSCRLYAIEYSLV